MKNFPALFVPQTSPEITKRSSCLNILFECSRQSEILEFRQSLRQRTFLISIEVHRRTVRNWDLSRKSKSHGIFLRTLSQIDFSYMRYRNARCEQSVFDTSFGLPGGGEPNRKFEQLLKSYCCYRDLQEEHPLKITLEDFRKILSMGVPEWIVPLVCYTLSSRKYGWLRKKWDCYCYLCNNFAA